MQLLFLRHGPAEAKNDWRGDDLERPLSAEGRLLVTDVAYSLVRQDTRLGLILTSPYTRAKQTAQIVSQAAGDGTQVLVDNRLAPGFSAKQLGKVLRDYGARDTLMLVAHEPDLSDLVRTLTGGGRQAIVAGLATLVSSVLFGARLAWFRAERAAARANA